MSKKIPHIVYQTIRGKDQPGRVFNSLVEMKKYLRKEGCRFGENLFIGGLGERSVTLYNGPNVYEIQELPYEYKR